MARKDQERIAPREEVRLAGPRAQLVTKAAPVDYAIPSGNGGELGALIQGLDAFGGSVARRQAQQDKFDAEEAKLSGALAGDSQVDPERVANLPPPEMPQGLNPAFKEHFDAAFKGNLGARIAGQVQDRVLAGYQANRSKPDFDPQAYLQEAMQKESAGIQDPTLRASVLHNAAKTAELVMADHRKVVLERLTQQEKDNITGLMGMTITPEMKPEDWAKVYYSDILPRARQGGIVTPAEAAEGFLTRIVAMSNSLGGRPEMFDAWLSAKDPATGQPPGDLNPKLLAQATVYKQHAQQMFDKKVEESMQGEYATIRRGFEEQARKGALPAFEDLKASLLGPGRPFKTDDQFIAYYHGLEQQAKNVVDMEEVKRRILSGNTLGIDGKLIKKGLEEIAAPAIEMIQRGYGEYLQTKDPRLLEGVRKSLGDVVNLYSTTGELNDDIKKLINAAAGQTMPKDGKPPGGFLLAAELYSAMPPGQREKYTDSNTQKMFDLFRLGVNQQMPEDLAYQKAMFGISGAGKRAEEAMKKSDSALNKNLGSALRAGVSDGSLWGWITTKMGYVPDNLRTSIEQEVAVDMLKLGQMQPELANDPDWVKMKVEDLVQRNYFRDPVNNTLVRKDPGIPPALATAVAAFKQEQYAAADPRIAASESKVVLSHLQGSLYQAMLVSKEGTPLKVIDNFDMQKAVQTMTLGGPAGSEGATNAYVKGELRLRARENRLDAAFLKENKDAISRLRLFGALDGEDLDSIKKAELKDLEFRAQKTLPTYMGKVNPAEFDTPASGYARGDTLKAASSFIDRGLGGLALTATREGFVATRYPDPAKKAGNNIGFGYNLSSRTRQVIEKDFRAAGIDEKAVDAILEGKASITLEQGMRLLENTWKDYEKKADDAIQQTLTRNARLALPKNVRDVLVDIAYQAGDVRQFHRAFTALQEGKTDNLDSLLKVHYEKEPGKMVPDVRGNQLRAHMLSSLETFKVGLQSAKGKPSTKIDALAATQNQPK